MKQQLHVAFVTIGQTPRSDIVPEMLSEIELGFDRDRLVVSEYGVLDGLEGAALDAMRAGEGEEIFATRLRDGTEIAISVGRTEARLNELLHALDGKVDLIVMLCTGTRTEPLARTLVIEAQSVVDKTVEALAASCRRLGVIVPLAGQVGDFSAHHAFDGETVVVSASPYSQGDFEAAASQLADCDLIVMHCMGYDSAMHERVKAKAGKPVLLSRRVVAGVARQLI